jgi:hypothetical protein
VYRPEHLCSIRLMIKTVNMLSANEANELSKRIECLACTDLSAGSGLFTFVLTGEPEQRAAAYRQHIAQCEYCKLAVDLYRYKRDAIRLLGKWERAEKIVASAQHPESKVLKKELGDKIAYFEPDESDQCGTTVVVGSKGEFVSVSNQTRHEFMHLIE